MQGRKRQGAVVLGALAVVPLATAEAADAYVVDDSGGGVPAKPKAAVPPTKPAEPKPPVPRAPRPANPTIHVDEPAPKQYADDRRQPRPEPKPAPAPAAEVPEPRPANPTIYTGHPTRRVEVPAPKAEVPAPKAEKPAPAPPPIGRQPQPPTPANPTIHVDEPAPQRYADDRRQPRPEPADAPDHMTPRPSDSPGERGEEAPPAFEPAEEAAEVEDDDGFSFGINVNLPGERFDGGVEVGVDPPELDPEWFTNPRKKLTEDSSEAVETGIRNTKDWLDEKPVCGGGSYYRYGGGGADLCVDTKTGDMFVSGELGVGNGGGIRFHRPDSLPEHPYCGGGVRVGSPALSGTYERRYGFGGQGWHNDFDYDLGIKYRRTKVGQSVTRSPSKGSHTGSGSKKPWVPPTTDPSHRGAPKPGKTLVKSIAPGTVNAYGTCGTPFRLN